MAILSYLQGVKNRYVYKKVKTAPIINSSTLSKSVSYNQLDSQSVSQSFSESVS